MAHQFNAVKIDNDLTVTMGDVNLTAGAVNIDAGNVVLGDGTTSTDIVFDGTSALTLTADATQSNVRTVTFPDVTVMNDVIVLEQQDQKLLNKQLDDNTVVFCDTDDITKLAQFQVNAAQTTSTTQTYTFPNASGELLLKGVDTGVIENKQFEDETTFIVDDGDNSKRMKFQLDGVMTGTTRILTVPDATDTLVLQDFSQKLTNKQLDDNTVVFCDTDDTSKLAQFQVNAAQTTSTTRTYTFPNADGILVLEDNEAPLTNKTLGTTTCLLDDHVSFKQAMTGTTAVTNSDDVKFNITGTNNRTLTLESPIIGASQTLLYPDKAVDYTTTPDDRFVLETNTTALTNKTLGTGTVLLDSEVTIKAGTGTTETVNSDTVQFDINSTNSDAHALIFNNTMPRNYTYPDETGTLALKSDVDSATAGLDVKLSVRAASIVPLVSNASIDTALIYVVTAGVSNRGQITATLDVSDVFTLDDVTMTSASDPTRVLIRAEELGTAEVHSVDTVADAAGSLNSTFFVFYTNQNTGYYVWYDVAAGGADPTPAAPAGVTFTGIEVDISTNDTANTVASTTKTAIDTANIDVMVVIDNGNEMTLTNTCGGQVTDVADGSAMTGFTISTDTQGVGLGPSANGIWTTTISGFSLTLDRATDFDEDDEVTAAAFTFIEEGTVCADQGWVLASDDVLTVGGAAGSALKWTQFSGAGSFVAGAGIVRNGNTIDVVGSATILVNADNVEVKSSGTVNQVLLSQGSGAAAYGAVLLSSSDAVTGTLAVGNGGTGKMTITENALLRGGAANVYNEIAPATDSVLVTDNTGTGVANWTTTLPSGLEIPNPYINDSLVDEFANRILCLTGQGMAVTENYVKITNAAAGSAPEISVLGGDTNIDMDFQAKGTGVYNLLSTADTAAELRLHEDTDNAAAPPITEYTGIKAAASIATAHTYTLPSAVGGVAQVLTIATGATAAAADLEWTNTATADTKGYSIISTKLCVDNAAFAAVGYFAWDSGKYAGATSRTVYFHLDDAANGLQVGHTFSMDVVDNAGTSVVTAGPLMPFDVVGTAGDDSATYSFTINDVVTAPTTDQWLEFQVRVTGGGTAIIKGIQLEFII